MKAKKIESIPPLKATKTIDKREEYLGYTKTKETESVNHHPIMPPIIEPSPAFCTVETDHITIIIVAEHQVNVK